jgi:hypothetical protein
MAWMKTHDWMTLEGEARLSGNTLRKIPDDRKRYTIKTPRSGDGRPGPFDEVQAYGDMLKTARKLLWQATTPRTSAGAWSRTKISTAVENINGARGVKDPERSGAHGAKTQTSVVHLSQQNPEHVSASNPMDP